MVAIVAGGQLGWGTSSWAELGGEGVLGKAAQGRAGESVLFNAATGNLVLRQRDELLIGRGPDAELLRTYNSQGVMDDAGDGSGTWLPGWGKQVYGLEGTLTAAGSSLWRRDADGARARHVYDAALGVYLTTAGEGAHDTLAHDAATDTWTWTEGSTRVSETYSKAGEHWRLSARRDAAGNTLTYTYDSHGRLARLTTPAGESTVLDYVEGRLARVRSLTAGGAESTRVRYAYDDAGRLTQVSVDLSPDDNSIADAHVYLTTYSYDGDSQRVATLSQSDGSRLEFTYAQLGDETAHRLVGIVEQVGDTRRQTRVSYDLSARTTTVTDPDGLRAVLTHDSAQRLLSVAHPATDGVARTVSYSYDSQGNLASRTDAGGRRTVFAYDAQGNRVLERDALGNTVTRQYSALGQLLSETAYAQPDPDGDAVQAAALPRTTRHVYDAASSLRLRFSVGAGGSVSEMRYDAFGQRMAEITYSDTRYEVAALSPGAQLDEVTLAAWAAQRDRTRASLTTYAYDARGALASRTVYARVDASGQGIADGTEAVTRTVHGPRGELLHQIDPRAAAARTLWSQDFSTGSAGLTDLPAGYMARADGALTVTALPGEGDDTWYAVSGTRLQAVGTLFRGEVTTGAASASRYLMLGADNGGHDGQLRRHMAWFTGGTIQAAWYDGEYTSLHLGLAKDDTTYVVEVHTDTRGSTLYVYEKGQDRGQGFSHRRDHDDWGMARIALEAGGSARFESAASVRVDNLSESTGPAIEPWRQDFSRDSLGLTALPDDFMQRRDGRLEVSAHPADEAVWPAVTGTRLQPVGTRLRAEISTSAAGDGRYLLYGADNAGAGGSLRRHMVWFGADGLYAHYRDTALSNVRLGSAKDHTTYVVEVHTDARGSTLHVYEKGQPRDSGFVDRRDYGDWGVVRTFLETTGDPDIAEAVTMTVDVLEESPPHVTSYLYDGLGRLVLGIDALGARTLVAYDDANRRTLTTLGNGLVTTARHDASGALLSETRADAAGTLATTRYAYDAAGRLRLREDANGVRQHLLYDSAGRKAAEIDGDGSLTEFTYDANDRLIHTRLYASAVGAEALAALVDEAGQPVDTAVTDVRPTPSTADRQQWRLYDAAGRLVKTLDATGAVVEHGYDGRSQLVRTRAYAATLALTGISRATLPTDRAVSPTAGTEDRVTRFFHDAEGRLVGELDATGALTELRYDAAGRLVRRIRYATPTNPTARAAGSLQDLIPTAHADDQITRHEHDAAGRLVGELDAQHYYTSFTYDVAGNLLTRVRHASAGDDAEAGAPSPSSDDQITRYTYDAGGRLLSETRPDGVRTVHEYDALGRRLHSTTAAGTGDARTHSLRHDSQGRVIAELTGEGSARLAGLTDAAAIAAVWRAHGMHHNYDATGLRTSTTNALGQRTLFIYDRDARLTHTVNALGEVSATLYDAQGNAVQTLRYATRLSADQRAALTGGLRDAAFDSLMATLTVAARTRAAYDAAGRLTGATDARDAVSRLQYNAFGDTIRVESPVDTLRTVVETRAYDAAGRLRESVRDAGGIARTERSAYDAFGRRVSHIDANRNQTDFGYDALDRLVSVRDALGADSATEYDAFDRVLRVTDRLGQVTAYRYDLVSRRVDITTPEGLMRASTRNAQGEVVSETDGNGTLTRHEYDRDGRLLRTTRAGATQRSEYDAAGRVLRTTDARGIHTTYAYDDAGRLIRRTLDPRGDDNPGGLHLTSEFRHDALGRTFWSRDAGGVWTRSEFDASGQLTAVTLDPRRGPDAVDGEADDHAQGLQLRTEYVYDAAGNVVRVTRGAGTAAAQVTAYTYDKLGRRTAESVDPDGLELTTAWTYDAHGNVTSRTDSGGAITRHLHDGAHRLRFTLDALNQVTRYEYDAEDRVVLTRLYARALSSPPKTLSLASVAAALAPDAADRLTRQIFDADGRQRYRIDAAGHVTAWTYDGNGNVLAETRHATPVSLSGTPGIEDIENALVADAHADRTTRHAYDAADRRRYTLDAAGYVSAMQYDAAGNLVAQTRHINPVSLAGTPSVTDIAAAVRADAAQDRAVRHFHDAAGRLRFSLDALGYVTEKTYDTRGNVLRETRYANALTGSLGGGAQPAIITGGTPGNGQLLADAARDVTTVKVYDAAGRVTESRARIDGGREAITRTRHDALGRAVAVTDALGNTGYIYYDAAGREIMQVDPAGYVTTRVYGSDGHIDRITRYGSAAQGTWDTGRAPAIVSRAPTTPGTPYLIYSSSRDQITTLTHDALGRQVRLQDAEGAAETIAYNAFGERARFTNKVGGVFLYEYDVRGLMSAEQLPVESRDAQGRAAAVRNTYTYNAFGERISQTEAAGLPEARATTFAYDALGRLVERRHAAVSVYDPVANKLTGGVVPTERWLYDAADNVLRHTAPDGRDLLAWYDALNRKRAEVNAGGVLTTWDYDSAGNRVRQVTHANTVQRQGGADAQLRPRLVSTAPADRERADAWVLVDASQDRAVTYTHDALGRQLSARVEDLTLGAYDAASGEYRIRTGALVTTQTWDANGHMLTSTDANGNLTRHWYNRAGQRVATVDAARHITVWERNANGDATLEHRHARAVAVGVDLAALPDLAQLRAAGALQTDAADRVTVYYYDQMNRLVQETRRNVAYGSVYTTIGSLTEKTDDADTYTRYNALGLVSGRTDAMGAVSDFAYDGLGRKTREQAAVFTDHLGRSVRPTTEFEYNGLGLETRRIQRGLDAATEDDDRITVQTHDAGGRLSARIDAEGQRTAFDHDIQGNVTRRTLHARRHADGSTRDDVVRMTYDALGRQLQSLDVGTGSVEERQYNVFGEITGKRTYVGNSPSHWDERSRYDRAGRAWMSNASDGIARIHVHDAQGNATLRIDSATRDLSALTLAQALALEDTQKSVSVYDARNQLVDTYEPEMRTARTGATVQANQTGQGVFFSSQVPVQISVSPSVLNTAATPTDAVTGGSVAASVGSLSIRGSVYSKPKPPLLGGGGGGGFVTYTTYYSSITVSLPTRGITAYGSGALRLYYAASVHTWGIGGGGAGNIVVPAGTSSVTLPEMIINQKRGSTYAAWGSIHFQLYQATDAGEVHIGGGTIGLGSSISGSAPLEKRLHIRGQPAGATRLLLAHRPAGSQGAWSLQWLWRTVNTGGASISGWFSAPHSALPQAAAEYEYFAMDDAGTVLNRQSGTFDLRSSSSPSATQASGATPGSTRQALVDTADAVHFVEQGNATSLTVRWRRRNSGDGWSVVSMPAAHVAGIYTPGWFGMAGSAFTHGTEYDLDIVASGDGQVVNCARAQLTRAADGRITFSPFVSYRPQPTLLRLTEQPAAQVLEVAYRAAGSSGGYQTVRLSPTAPGSGVFEWDASALVGDMLGNTDYEWVLRAFDQTGFARNETRATVRLGAAPAVLSASTGNHSILRVSSPHAGSARISLGYRRQDSTGPYTALDAQPVEGEFRASIAALKPPASGSLTYEYLYESYDINGTLLGRDTGTFTLSAAGASNARLQWVLQDLGATGTRIHRAQRYNAFGEIASETDGLGRLTEFDYNTLGKLIEKRSPQTSATLSNGYVQSLRPATRYHYDLAGRAVGTEDANGNLRTQVWRPGATDNAVVLERGADGALARHRYDVFGDKRHSLNALWDGKSAETAFRTEYTYDKLGQLLEMRHPERAAGALGNAGASAVRAVETWTWDGAGHRISHVNALGDTDTTAYDSLGRVRATTSAQGFTTAYAYDYRADLRGLGGATVGGWRKTTTEPTGRTQIEHTDAFGRLTWRQDLGGHQFTYTYNHAGWLTAQSGTSGQRIVREYYANGLLKSYWDQVTGAFSSYAYDANGNRTFEGYVTLRSPASLSAGVREHHQHATLEYDELNRLVRVFDPRADIRYEYDAVGNRRRVFSSYHDGVDGSRVTQDYWYTYDKENRFLITLGQLSGGRSTSASTSARVITGGTGVAIAYDAAGRRVQAVNGSDSTQENYGYSAEGYLVEVRIDTNLADKTPGIVRSRRDIDLAGRVIAYHEFGNGPGGPLSGLLSNPDYTRVNRYDKDHRLLSQSGTDGEITYRYYTDATDNAASASGAGAGALAHTTHVKDGTTVNTFHAYEYWDSAREKAQTSQAYNPALGDRNARWKPGYAKHEYDVNGNLARALDAGPDGVLGNGDDRQLRYLTDAQGLILRRDEVAGSAINRVHRYYYATGVRVGDVGNDGPSRIDYAQALARRGESRDYRQWKPVSAADFDQNYEPVGPNYPGHTPARYTVKAGDTLIGIAAALWGDRALWYLLAEANGLSGGESLIAGQVLTVPNKLTNVHNNSGTFRVYQPGEAIGDTSPTLPDAPPPPARGKGCAMLVSILIVAVVVVVSVYTAGVATGWFAAAGVPAGAAASTAAGATTVSAAATGAGAAAFSLGTTAMAGGAGLAGFMGAMLGAAVGSAVGQGLSMAAGMQEEFSWRQVGLAALGAGVSAGIGSAVGALGNDNAFGQWLNNNSLGQAAQAAVGNTLTQGLSTKFGFQAGFDWSAVGASALAADAQHQVSKRVGAWQYDAHPNDWREVQQDLANGFGEADAARHAARTLLSSAAANVAREAVSRGSFNLTQVVADTLGGVTGNSLVNSVISADVARSVLLALELGDVGIAQPYDATREPWADGSTAAQDGFVPTAAEPGQRKGLRSLLQQRDDGTYAMQLDGKSYDIRHPDDPVTEVVMLNATMMSRAGDELAASAQAIREDPTALARLLADPAQHADLLQQAGVDSELIVQSSSHQEIQMALAQGLERRALAYKAVAQRALATLSQGTARDVLLPRDPGAFHAATDFAFMERRSLGSMSKAGIGIQIAGILGGPGGRALTGAAGYLISMGQASADQAVARTMFDLGLMSEGTYREIKTATNNTQRAENIGLVIGGTMVAAHGTFNLARGAIDAIGSGEKAGSLLAFGTLGGRVAERIRESLAALLGRTAKGVEIASGKLDYIFGRVASNAHNSARSNQLALEMKRLGISDTSAGRQLLREHFSGSARTVGNVVRSFSNQHGRFEVRESLFLGPSGKAVKFESTFQILGDGTRRLSTTIPFR